ncbi:MAG: ornithine cyclodeaminase/mu-crystallin [Ramlibacter sp.]|nr:ornithine cyclodeaminase/mu-crystallin [Ramlibacter sp.]
MSNETVLLGRTDVLAALSPPDCIDRIEAAFREAALGRVAASGILGMHAPAGSFHVKAGLLEDAAPWFAAKVNANFPMNPARSGLPTIQGAVLLFHAGDGRLLAVIDSTALTALRTAAATAVAARYLARPSSRTLLICGCGAQALEQLRALSCVTGVDTVLGFDLDGGQVRAFAAAAERATGRVVQVVGDLEAAVRRSDIIVTCTPAKHSFLRRDMVAPGTFVAAVGADHEDKQELAPDLMAAAKVVTDFTDQACRIGDLHHAIAAGAMQAGDVHAELGELAAGLRPGRTGEDEITIFDSTGTGLQDVAAAIAVYQGALRAADRPRAFSFG